MFSVKNYLKKNKKSYFNQCVISILDLFKLILELKRDFSRENY